MAPSDCQADVSVAGGCGSDEVEQSLVEDRLCGLLENAAAWNARSAEDAEPEQLAAFVLGVCNEYG